MSPAKERRRELKREVWRAVATFLEGAAREAEADRAEAMLHVARACRNAASGAKAQTSEIPTFGAAGPPGWPDEDIG